MLECKTCGKNESEVKFYKASKTKCSICYAWQVRCWNRANPITIMLRDARYRAKKRGLEFSLDKSDIIIPEFCPALGIPLFHADYTGKAGPCPNSPTLDRIYNNKGYVKGNVVVISSKANTMKHTGCLEDLEKLTKWLRGLTSESGM